MHPNRSLVTLTGLIRERGGAFGFGISQTMAKVLHQCNGNFSRPNVMAQAENLHDFEVPVLLPGIKLNTSRTDHRPIKQMQMQRWAGTTWKRFGGLVGNTV